MSSDDKLKLFCPAHPEFYTTPSILDTQRIVLMKNPLIRKIIQAVVAVFQQSFRTSLELFKIVIPVSILTRLLTEFGMIVHIGEWLGPVMELVGLPGSMGVVWATAMLTNLYAGMIVFSSLAPAAQLTVAQVTVLATLMLVAHALPIELRIAQKSGPRFRVMAPLRLLGSFALGWILFHVYQSTGYLQVEHVSLWSQSVKHLSWAEWVLVELRNYLSIFLIITALIVIMKAMNRLRITAALTWILGPVLRLMGMSKNAAPLTIIGMIMGISYGGGLIIQEAKSRRLTPRDIFISLTVLGLFHSVIEDTLLMMVMGGHVSGILWGRMLFMLLVVFFVVRLFNIIPIAVLQRNFYRQSADGG